MRPSHYHYIKRMWCRNMYSKKRKSIFSLPFRILYLPFKPFVWEGKMLFLGALWTGKKLSSVEPGPISASLSQKEKLHSSTPRKNKPKHSTYFVLILCGIVFFIAAMFSASSAESTFEETLIISIIAGVLLGIGIEKLVSNREKSSPAKMKAISRKDGICDEFLNKDFVLFEDDNDIEKFNLIERKKEPSINLERYAVMCNAYLEHQDELAQYEETQSESS